MNNDKVFIIGIDGATFDIIRPLIHKGLLPNIAKLMKDGVYGRLLSTIPTVSPVAWTSFATGKNPGKHGIFDFIGRVPNSYKTKINNARVRKSKPIWAILSENNRSVSVINIPMSYPPDEVNGYMISGLGTPDISSDFTFPPNLYQEIKKEIGEHVITPDIDIKRFSNSSKSDKDGILTDFFEAIENRVIVTKYLMGKKSFDFIMVVFGETDYVSHMFWNPKYNDPIFKIYQKVDEAIGELIKDLNDNTNIVIVSDHGFQPVHKAIVLNNWLRHRGYLKIKKAELSQFSKALKISKYWAKRWLPDGLKEKISKLTGGRKKVASQLEHDFFISVDWENTTAYSMGTSGDIFINLKGREPLGIVNYGNEYKNLCNNIKMDLMKLEDPTNGAKVVEYVYRKEEIVHGKFIGDAPDLFVIFSKGYVNKAKGWIRGKLYEGEKVVVKSGWSGGHEINGILIMKGPHIKKGSEVIEASILDIAPTILHLLGVPVPDDMDGNVLVNVIDSDFMLRKPIKYNKVIDEEKPSIEKAGYKDDEAQKVKERLKALGYLE